MDHLESVVRDRRTERERRAVGVFGKTTPEAESLYDTLFKKFLINQKKKQVQHILS